MIETKSNLNIVRIGNSISYSSLKEIGNRVLDSFQGVIEEYQLSHHSSPVIGSIDAERVNENETHVSFN